MTSPGMGSTEYFPSSGDAPSGRQLAVPGSVSMSNRQAAGRRPGQGHCFHRPLVSEQQLRQKESHSPHRMLTLAVGLDMQELIEGEGPPGQAPAGQPLRGHQKGG